MKTTPAAAVRLTGFFDGAGYAPAPAPCAYGAVLFHTETGVAVAELHAPIGLATTNVAEYRGLLAVVEAAIALFVTDLTLYGDSEVVVRQVHGGYRTYNSQLIVLRDRARELLAQVPNWSLTHVRRTYNTHADLLSKIGLAECMRQLAAS